MIAQPFLRQTLLPEFEHELANTRKTLARIPEDKHDWKPHPSSFALMALATHIAQIYFWMSWTIEQREFDAAKESPPSPTFTKTADLLAFLDKNAAGAKAALVSASDQTLMEEWTLRNGEQIFFTMPRIAVLRGMIFNHIVHHRAQLTVYFRMLGVPVPSLYGPSGDEAV